MYVHVINSFRLRYHIDESSNEYYVSFFGCWANHSREYCSCSACCGRKQNFLFKICFGKLFFMCFFSIQCLQFYLTNQSTSFYFLDSWSVAKGFSPATTVLLPRQKFFFTPRSEPMYIICLWLGKAGNHFLCN